MTEAAALRIYLSDFTRDYAPPGRHRRQLLALPIVAAGQVLLLVLLEQAAPPLKPLADVAAITVGLVPGYAANSAPTRAAAKPLQAALKPAPQEEMATPKPPPRSAVPANHASPLAPVDPTSEPAEFATAQADPQTPADSQSQADGAAGTTCDLTGALQAALQGDARVVGGLARIPRRAKSVANAVMLWDGRWTDAEAIGGPTVAQPIRDAILAVVQATSASCQSQPVQGPRLLSIIDQSGTTVIALGSGSWKWADLLTTAQPGG